LIPRKNANAAAMAERIATWLIAAGLSVVSRQTLDLSPEPPAVCVVGARPA